MLSLTPNGDLMSSAPPPLEALEAKEERRMVRAAVKTLPQRRRQIIYLFYWKGMTIQQIASFLGITPQAVSKSRMEALQQLRELLKDYMVAG